MRVVGLNGLFFTFAFLGWIAEPVDAQAQLYWSNSTTLYTSSADGIDQISIATGLGIGGVRSIFATEDYVYFVPSSGINVGYLRRIDRVGHGNAVTIATGVNTAAWDPVGERIYYTMNSAGVRSSDMAGGDVRVVSTEVTFYASIIRSNVAVDPIHRKLYWFALPEDGGDFDIVRANLDGTDRTVVVPWLWNQSGARIALDPYHDRMYILGGQEEEVDAIGSLVVANLDGTNIDTYYGSDFNNCYDIAVEPFVGAVYITCTDGLWRLPLDVSEKTVMISSNKVAVSAFVEATPFLTIDDEPVGTNCEHGGALVRRGRDTNRSRTFDEAEIESSQYFCSGGGAVAGHSALVSTSLEASGAHCARGGTRVDIGVDDDADGELDTVEVDETRYVCNGAGASVGSDGRTSRVSTSNEPIGANCAYGGSRIDVGFDANDNDELDLSEIASTRYVCNGPTTGTTGPSRVETHDEAAGTHCMYGGSRIDVGLDANSNDMLDAEEITSTNYVCNGPNGATTGASLVATATEPNGTHCAHGGSRIDVGLDANDNGTLDASEISSTRYLCNGSQTAPARVTVESEPSGENCAYGGKRIVVSQDRNGDGSITDNEISNASFLCTLPVVTLRGGGGCSISNGKHDKSGFVFSVLLVLGAIFARARRMAQSTVFASGKEKSMRAMFNLRAQGFFLAMLGTLMLSAPSSAHAEDEIYFFDNPNKLYVSRFNGHDLRELCTTPSSLYIGGMAVSSEYIFMSAKVSLITTYGPGTSIYRVDRRTGTGFTTINSTSGPFWRISHDPVTDRLYFLASDGIGYMNVDGGDVHRLHTLTANVEAGFAIDPTTRTMFWTEPGTNANEISVFRANLDGTNITEVLSGIHTFADDWGSSVAIDSVHGKLYVLGQATFYNGFTYANLDGSDPQARLYSDGIWQDLAIAPYQDAIFMLGGLTSTLSRVGLDGDHLTVLVSDSYQAVGLYVEPGTEQILDIDPETAGANCASGGVRITIGTDVNRNDDIDADEITGTRFVCDGNDGRSVLIASAQEAAGANCEFGGVRIDVGVDDDHNGLLAELEVDETQYLCNGEDGSGSSAGHDSLITSSAEAAGDNCENGGVRIDSGLDENDNTMLDSGEITTTRYLCNGAGASAPHRTLVVTTDEAEGTNCENGGVRIDSGVDANDNSTLDGSEISSTRYVCNGAGAMDPPRTLVATTDEPAGANCANGGVRIDSGVDTNSSGALDTSEILSTRYVCGGANGANALVDVSNEAAGDNCTHGGLRIDSGRDTSGDGELASDEVESTAYVCTDYASANDEGGCSVPRNGRNSNAALLGLLAAFGIFLSRRRAPRV